MSYKQFVFLAVCVNVAFALDLSSFFGNGFSSLKTVARKEYEKSGVSDVIADVRDHMLVKDVASSMLLQGQPIMNKGVDHQIRLEDNGMPGRARPFNWSSCGSGIQLLEIRNLTIAPAPLSLPGPLSFAFDIIFHEDVDGNVTASLELDILAGGNYIKIPCFGSIGSCTYHDLCTLLKGVSCPAELTEQGIPCHCPFRKGEYKLKKYKVVVLSEVFIPGSYHAVIKMKSQSLGEIGCYKIHFVVV